MTTSLTRTRTTSIRPKKFDIDWDAIERDYRTDKLTLRELAAKHGGVHTTIARRAEKQGWNKDLTDAIRQATNSKLVQQSVQLQCNNAHQSATETVLAAAELNIRIIQGHRVRLTALYDAVTSAKDKLMELGDAVTDIREAATFVQAVSHLATATKTLIEQERKAHNLDEEVDAAVFKQKRVLLEFVEAHPK